MAHLVAYFRWLRETRTSLTPLLAFLGVLAAAGRSWWSVSLAAGILLALLAWDFRRWHRAGRR